MTKLTTRLATPAPGVSLGSYLRAGWPARVVALATVVYSVSIVANPKILGAPTGIAKKNGSVSTSKKSLIRAIGTRDALLAATLAVAPAGNPIRVLSAVRALSDVADAYWLGSVTADRRRLVRVSGVALGWAAIQAGAGYARTSPEPSDPKR